MSFFDEPPERPSTTSRRAQREQARQKRVRRESFAARRVRRERRTERAVTMTIVVWGIFCLALVIGIVIVAAHFITKYW